MYQRTRRCTVYAKIGDLITHYPKEPHVGLSKYGAREGDPRNTAAALGEPADSDRCRHGWSSGSCGVVSRCRIIVLEETESPSESCDESPILVSPQDVTLTRNPNPRTGVNRGDLIVYSVVAVDLTLEVTSNCTSVISVGDCDQTWCRPLPGGLELCFRALRVHSFGDFRTVCSCILSEGRWPSCSAPHLFPTPRQLGQKSKVDLHSLSVKLPAQERRSPFDSRYE